MKIVHLNTYSNGSTGKIARMIVSEENAQGHDSMLLYARGPQISDIPNLRISGKLSVLIDGLKTRIFDNQGLNSKGSTRRLIKRLKKNKPDKVHLHNLHGYYLNYKILFRYLKEENIEVEWTLHDCWAFTGHCAYYSYCGCDKWKTLCENCPQKKSYPKSMLLNRAKHNYLAKKEAFTGLDVDRVTLITPSQWLADEVKSSFLSNYRIVVKHNEIDREIFKNRTSKFRVQYQIESKKIVLGVANKWEERKGLGYFLQLDKLLNINEYAIVLVGLSDKQKKHIEKSTNIIAITRTNNQIELAEIYSSSDCLFNPTLEENYPTVNLEAQACGTKVISFDTGGSKETDLGNGLFYLTNKDNFMNDICLYLK